MSRVSKSIIIIGFAVAVSSNLYLRFGPKDLSDEIRSLKEVFPGADYFSGKLENPPHYLAYKATTSADDRRIIGYCFLTTDLAPDEAGYSGPIKVLIGVDAQGKIVGIKLLRHSETPSYVRSFPQFLSQFEGKSVYDRFNLGDDLDAMTGATVTSAAAARCVRKSVRAFAKMKLGLDVEGERRLFREQFRDVNIYLTAGVFLFGIISLMSAKRWMRKSALFVAMVYLGFLIKNYVSAVNFSNLLLWRSPPISYNFLWYLTFALSVILSLAVAGFFCGWVCPFGAAQELSKGCLRKRITLSESARSKVGNIRAGILFLVIIMAIALDNPNVSNFEPFATLFAGGGSVLAWAYLALVASTSFFNSRFFCKYLCAAGAVFGWLSRFGIYKVRGSSACKGCGICISACPTEAIEYHSRPGGEASATGAFAGEEKLKFDYSRCISCLECVRLCPQGAVKLAPRRLGEERAAG